MLELKIYLVLVFVNVTLFNTFSGPLNGHLYNFSLLINDFYLKLFLNCFFPLSFLAAQAVG